MTYANAPKKMFKFFNCNFIDTLLLKKLYAPTYYFLSNEKFVEFIEYLKCLTKRVTYLYDIIVPKTRGNCDNLVYFYRFCNSIQ